MNLSKQAREVIGQMGRSFAKLYAMRLSSLQILILVEARYSEARLGKGQHLFANKLRAEVTALYEDNDGNPPSRQAFWDAFNVLCKRRLLYIAPHKRGTTKRAVALTAAGADPFEYPKSIHPYRPTS